MHMILLRCHSPLFFVIFLIRILLKLYGAVLNLAQFSMANEFLLILANYRCNRCFVEWHHVLMGFRYQRRCPRCRDAVEPFNWVYFIRSMFFVHFQCFKDEYFCVQNTFQVQFQRAWIESESSRRKFNNTKNHQHFIAF